MDVFAKDRKALVVCGTQGQDMNKTKGNNSGALWLFEQSKASFVCVGGGGVGGMKGGMRQTGCSSAFFVFLLSKQSTGVAH